MTGTDDHSKSALAAREAAEAIRTLNHLTIRDTDLRYPADVYAVLGALSTLAGRLPQTLQQLTGFLERQLQDGVIGIDADAAFAGDPVTAVAAAATALEEEAVPAAQQLQSALVRAQRAISGASSSASLSQ
jgi:hypothetical protein